MLATSDLFLSEVVFLSEILCISFFSEEAFF